MTCQQSFLLKVFVAALLVFAPTCVFAVTVTEIVIPIPGVTFLAANAINDRDQVVGFYFADGTQHCFLWEEDSFQTIDVPATRATSCYGINNRGQIVGSYLDSGGMIHDFLWDKGAVSEINVPGTPVPIGGVNDRGQVVGTYAAGGAQHCFLWDENGAFQTIDDVPATTQTACHGINNRIRISPGAS
jgi:uncharacterized membrane protein